MHRRLSPHPVTYLCSLFSFFFFNDTATTEIYTLSLHDALPIWSDAADHRFRKALQARKQVRLDARPRYETGAEDDQTMHAGIGEGAHRRGGDGGGGGRV